MVTGLQQAADNYIQGFRNIFGKYNIFGILTTKKIAQQLASSKHGLLCRIRASISAAANIAAHARHILVHSISYLARLRKGSASVIKINLLHKSPSKKLPLLYSLLYSL